MKSQILARGVSELPNVIFSQLDALSNDGVDAALGGVLEQIVSATGADSSVLYSLDESEAPVMIAQWSRPVSRAEALTLEMCPWLHGRVTAGETIIIGSTSAQLPSFAVADIAHLNARSIAALIAAPIRVDDRCILLVVHSSLPHPEWNAETAGALQFVGSILRSVFTRRHLYEQLQRAQADLARYTQRVESQNRAFKDDVRNVHDFDELVGQSPAFRAALAGVREVAPTDTTALLLGETGTGKELFARAIHEGSARRHRPFVCVNCAALPASLIESELFGHERGAFTGAVAARQGRFELADRGTIFLDEIGDLPLELQPKLLRVLQEQKFERLGSSTSRKVDVRVIAATHHDLMTAVTQGRFRADLYYRLGIFPIALPPLRERVDDIPQLVWFLVNRRQRRLHKHITEIAPATLEALQRYQWPGNVRELENVVERAMIRSTDGVLRIDEQLVTPRAGSPPDDGSLRSVERAHIEDVLRRCRGRINGNGNAAERLGLHPNTLRFRLKKLGIVREATRGGGPVATAGA
jgi:formate hydrogenlyase transcriptional activator